MIISVLFLCLISSGIAAEQAKLDTAIQYEKEGKVIHALASYWDILEQSSVEESFEAYRRYTELSEAIINGNPCTEEFGIFERYDKWIMLAKDYELLWNEECPFYIIVSDLRKNSTDLQNRTANFSLSLTTELTKKYSTISSIVKKGFAKIYRADWKEIDKNWPSLSIFNAERDNFEKEGIILAASTAGNANNIQTFNAACCWSNISIQQNQKKQGLYYQTTTTSNTEKTFDSTLYDVAIKILDENGTVLAQTNRELAGKNVKLEFTVTDQTTIRKLESYKISFAVDELYLEYGDISKRDGKSRAWLRTTKEKRLSPSFIRLYIEGDPELDTYQKTNVISKCQTYYQTHNGKYAVGDIILAEGTIVKRDDYQKDPSNKAIAVIAFISNGNDGGERFTAYGIGTTVFFSLEKYKLAVPIYYNEDGYRTGSVIFPTEEERSDEYSRNSLATSLYEDFLKNYAYIAGLPEKLSEGWAKPLDSFKWQPGYEDFKNSITTILPNFSQYDSERGLVYRAFK